MHILPGRRRALTAGGCHCSVAASARSAAVEDTPSSRCCCCCCHRCSRRDTDDVPSPHRGSSRMSAGMGSDRRTAAWAGSLIRLIVFHRSTERPSGPGPGRSIRPFSRRQPRASDSRSKLAPKQLGASAGVTFAPAAASCFRFIIGASRVGCSAVF
jgi:hypothetical protein